MKYLAFLLFPILILCTPSNERVRVQIETKTSNSVKYARINDIPVPDGFKRAEAAETSFARYLRTLPLYQDRDEVLLYNGRHKRNQQAHFAIVNMDIGNSDLQQCADAVIRLRAEYLYSEKKYDEIRFNFTSGDEAAFVKYAEGYRPKINGNKVSWAKTASPADDYQTFRKYLDMVFTYAGSWSLSKELKPIENVVEIAPGDVFIEGGFPGHAVIVADVAVNAAGEKVFMLAQSYMPAQDIHVLKNPNDQTLSPWYEVDAASSLVTPEWVFPAGSLKRFH